MPVDDYEDLEPFTVADVSSGATRILGNALCAQLWPLTGNRSTGTAVVTATGADVVIPANSYGFPVLDGEANQQMLLKVAHNPVTRGPHQTGGHWTVTSAGTPIQFKSNVGGLKMNIAAGSLIRFSPPIPGLASDVVVQAPGFTGGTNGLVLDVRQYDDIGTPDQARAMLQGKLGNYPALVLAWLKSTPIEGRTAGVAQGSTRQGRDARAYFENFILYVISSNAGSGELRRAIALNLKDAVIDLLNDYKRNFDGEVLTAMGTGVEVLDSNRVPKIEQATTISMALRTIAVSTKTNRVSYSPWLRTRYRSYVAAEPAEVEGDPPVHADDLELSDPIDPMPRE
jgi:hypothetical protein